MDRFFPTREPEDPWFRVGPVDVTTTVLICGLSVISMIVWAIARTLWTHLVFSSYLVRQGQVWRLITWPLATSAGLWAAVSVAIFFLFGREIERLLGRYRFLVFLAIAAVVPAAIATLLDLEVLPTSAGVALLVDAVFLIFVLRYPFARSFFNIPLWLLGAAFLGIEALQLIGARPPLWGNLWFLLIELGTAVLMARAMGILDELDWLPRIPLPRSLSGEGGRPRRHRQPRPPRAPRAKPATKRRRGPAEVIPMRPSQPTVDDLLRQAEIDVLLDKISEHGLDSLTPEERRRLDEHSRHLRGEG